MRVPDPSPRAVRIAWAVVVVAALLLVGWLIVTVLHLSEQNKDAAARDAAQDDALTKANSRLIDLGAQPVPTPSPGPAGEPGVTGPTGPAGLTGAQGPQGIQGPRGAVGPTGARGLRGNLGPIGLRGEMGPQGEKGEAGAQGPAGERGSEGPQGPAGADGKDGADGQDAFPFTFRFKVQTNPAQSTIYTVTCTADGCTVTESPGETQP